MPKIRYSTPGTTFEVLNDTTLTAFTLSAAGAEFDNTSNRDTHAMLQATISWVTTPFVDETLELYLLPSYDGTNYPTSDDGPANLAIIIPIKALDDQVFTIGIPIEIPPTKFKMAMYNRSSVDIDSYVVEIRPTSKEIS